MPVMQNAAISKKEKSIPPSTAKPFSMDAAAAHSRKKYQVLWVNFSFIVSLPAHETAWATANFRIFPIL